MTAARDNTLFAREAAAGASVRPATGSDLQTRGNLQPRGSLQPKTPNAATGDAGIAAPPGSASNWRLEILQGPNAGAELALSPGLYRLGLAAANDIVLSDPALAPEHLLLTVSAKGAVITAHAPGVDLRRTALAEGTARTVRAGSEVRVGSTVMRLHGPAAASAPSRSALACAAAAGLAVALLTFAAGTSRAPHAAIAQSVPPRAASPNDAAAALIREVGKAGLSDSVTISPAGNGALLAAGILPPSSVQAWHGVRTWFDATYGIRVTLLEHFDAATGNGQPPISVAAVALTPVPLVITRDGSRYTEGAMLPGGWEVRSITASAVTLSRTGGTEPSHADGASSHPGGSSPSTHVGKAAAAPANGQVLRITL